MDFTCIGTVFHGHARTMFLYIWRFIDDGSAFSIRAFSVAPTEQARRCRPPVDRPCSRADRVEAWRERLRADVSLIMLMPGTVPPPAAAATTSSQLIK